MDAGLIQNYIIIGLIFVVPLLFFLRKTKVIQNFLHRFRAQTPSQKTRTIVIAVIAVTGLFVAYRILMAVLFALLIMSGIPCGEAGGVYCTDSNFFVLFVKLLFGQTTDL